MQGFLKNPMKSPKTRKARDDRQAASSGEAGDHKGILTTAQAAELLRVTTSTVARWAHEGKIPCHFTLGGHRRFERSVIEELSRTVDRVGHWSKPAMERKGRSRARAKHEGGRNK
jgi:excisionase family DNA binding protein